MNLIFEDFLRFPMCVSLFWLLLFGLDKHKQIFDYWYIVLVYVFNIVNNILFITILKSTSGHSPITYSLFLFSNIVQFPALYIFILRQTKMAKYKNVWSHFILPSMVLVLSSLTLIFFNSINNRFLYIFDSILLYVIMLTGVFYVAIISRIVTGYNLKLHDNFSSAIGHKLGWYRVSSIVYFVEVTLMIWSFSLSSSIGYGFVYIISIIQSIIYWYFAYKIYHFEFVNFENNPSGEFVFLNSQERLFEEIKLKIEDRFIKEKKYLLPNISLPFLAMEIGTNRSYISKVINDTYGQNFNQFVNKLRIDEFEQLYEKNKKYKTIKELAEVCGYNNYSSFVRAFKDVKGKPPADYYRCEI